jgi:ribosomal protein S18 acetylase RimI-like enzyme
MSVPAFRIELLGEQHDRESFACGEEALDRYLRTQATQDIRRRVATCVVAIEVATGRLAGYYTIAAASIPTPDLPPEITKKLPRYPTLPAVRIGGLAVDGKFRGRGLGGALLADALQRVLVSPPAVFTLLVDAKDDQAVAFYRRYGFTPLGSQPRTLFLPVATAQKLFA